MIEEIMLPTSTFQTIEPFRIINLAYKTKEKIWPISQLRIMIYSKLSRKPKEMPRRKSVQTPNIKPSFILWAARMIISLYIFRPQDKVAKRDSMTWANTAKSFMNTPIVMIRYNKMWHQDLNPRGIIQKMNRILHRHSK